MKLSKDDLNLTPYDFMRKITKWKLAGEITAEQVKQATRWYESRRPRSTDEIAKMFAPKLPTNERSYAENSKPNAVNSDYTFIQPDLPI
jgi:hypothetical protein